MLRAPFPGTPSRSLREVEPGTKREFGHAEITVREDVSLAGASSAKRAKGRSLLFKDIGDQVPTWMSHGDKVTKLPDGFTSVAFTSNTEYAAVENRDRRIYGVQFHPEVTHTPCGGQLIKNFCLEICGCKGEWKMEDFAKLQTDQIMSKLDGGKCVVGAVSGGVDSSVAAALVHKAPISCTSLCPCDLAARSGLRYRVASRNLGGRHGVVAFASAVVSRVARFAEAPGDRRPLQALHGGHRAPAPGRGQDRDY